MKSLWLGMQIFGGRIAESGVLWHNAIEAHDLGLKRIDMVIDE